MFLPLHELQCIGNTIWFQSCIESALFFTANQVNLQHNTKYHSTNAIRLSSANLCACGCECTLGVVYYVQPTADKQNTAAVVTQWQHGYKGIAMYRLYAQQASRIAVISKGFRLDSSQYQHSFSHHQSHRDL